MALGTLSAGGRTTRPLTMRSPELDRISGIDIGRYVAFIAIVSLHTLTFAPVWTGPSALGLIDHASRFAVPFFFIVSGYFAAGRDISAWQAIRRVGWRLLPVYLGWVAIYAVLSGTPAAYFGSVGAALRTLANGGAGFHLWFLPSLGVGTCAVLIARKYSGYKGIAALALTFYAAGLCLASYRTAAGFSGEISRAGPLFAFAFIALGFWFRENNIKLSAKAALGLAIAGLAFQIAEAWILSANALGPFTPHNFLIGTLPFGLGVFALSLHMRAEQLPFGQKIARLGRMSFGMYCIHLLFVWLFTWMMMPIDAAHSLVVSLAVIMASTAAVYAISYVPGSRRLIQ